MHLSDQYPAQISQRKRKVQQCQSLAVTTAYSPNVRFCPSCGTQLSASTADCRKCGAALRNDCGSCGAANLPASRFCSSCGTPLTNVPPFTIRTEDPIADQATERREVTVLFADVTDFTATSSRLDSEDVYSFIDEALKLLADVVNEYEGTIDKFTGDGLMALFGAPLAHENDAERAVRAAWDMQRVIRPLRERLSAQHGFELRIRIGVHTGEVVAGRIGSAAHTEYTVIGDTVNLASRLQTAAEPNSVLVSDTTYDRTAANFRYEPVPPLALKGIPGPVTAYRVAGVQPHVSPQRGVPGMTVPLIGRESATALLQETMPRMRATGRTQIAFVCGEAGVGKTRLVHEFLRDLDRTAVQVHGARCIALSRSRPLTLAADVLRAILGIDAADPVIAQGHAAETFIAAHQLPREELLPYVLNVLGLPQCDDESEHRLGLLDEAMLQQQTHAALRRVIMATTRLRPVVLVFDDLHWVDSASRDFLQYFIQSAGDQPLLIIVISRHLERATTVRPLIDVATAHGDRFVEIDLEPLGATDSRRLVKKLVPGDTVEASALRQKIISRAEGNPFYVEELVRMLLDRGGLVGDPGEWRVTGQAAALLQDVPSSLRGLMVTRFDCLPRELRRVLQRAAILGRSFPVRLLQDLLADSAIDVAASLEELESREFLDEEAFGLEKGYAFAHALIQEAIHSTLLKRDRQEMHREVAEAVERGNYWPTNERDEVLAYHYSDSGEAAKAVPYLLAAAERSARRHANDVASDHYRRALEILRTSPEGDRDQYNGIELLYARSLKYLGRLSETRNILEVALNDVSKRAADIEMPPYRLLAGLLVELADVEVREGLLDHAAAHLDMAQLTLAEFAGIESKTVRHTVVERLAWVRFRQRRLDEALLIADELAREIEEDETGDPVALANLYNTLGGILWSYGSLDQAAEYVRKSLALYHKIGYLFGKANAHMNLGILYYGQGRWKEAAQSYERSDFIRREIGYVVGRAENLLNLAALRLAMGEHEEARRDFEASLSVSVHLGEEFVAASALIGLAQVAIVQARSEDAEAALVSLTAYDRALTADHRIDMQWLSALLAADRNVDDAIVLAEEACRTASECGVRDSEADSTRVLGLLHARRGDQPAAEIALQKSIDAARKVGDPYREALALLELGSARHCNATIEEAARMLERLGAAHDAHRAVSALS